MFDDLLLCVHKARGDVSTSPKRPLSGHHRRPNVAATLRKSGLESPRNYPHRGPTLLRRRQSDCPKTLWSCTRLRGRRLSVATSPALAVPSATRSFTERVSDGAHAPMGRSSFVPSVRLHNSLVVVCSLVKMRDSPRLVAVWPPPSSILQSPASSQIRFAP